MEWLLISVVASVVLTVVLNVVIRLWPGGAERSARRIDRWAEEAKPAAGRDDEGIRVIVPWKAMLLVSLGLTVALNLFLVVAR